MIDDTDRNKTRYAVEGLRARVAELEDALVCAEMQHADMIRSRDARLALARRVIAAADAILDTWGDLDGSARETLASAVERYDDVRPEGGCSHGIDGDAGGGET